MVIKYEYLEDDEAPKERIVEALKKEIENIESLKFPKKPKGKAPVSIRFPPEVLDYFQAIGPGWQTKINEVLMDYILTEKLKLRKD